VWKCPETESPSRKHRRTQPTLEANIKRIYSHVNPGLSIREPILKASPFYLSSGPALGPCHVLDAPCKEWDSTEVSCLGFPVHRARVPIPYSILLHPSEIKIKVNGSGHECPLHILLGITTCGVRGRVWTWQGGPRLRGSVRICSGPVLGQLRDRPLGRLCGWVGGLRRRG
jgi:hypothetical protein